MTEGRPRKSLHYVVAHSRSSFDDASMAVVAVKFYDKLGLWPRRGSSKNTVFPPFFLYFSTPPSHARPDFRPYPRYATLSPRNATRARDRKGYDSNLYVLRVHEHHSTQRRLRICRTRRDEIAFPAHVRAFSAQTRVSIYFFLL